MAASAVAAAQDVSWTITGPANVAPGAPIAWQASVDVVADGSTQGLAGYAFHVVVGPSPGPTPGPDGAWGTADDENLADVQLAPAGFVNSFQVQGSTPPPGAVTHTGSAGGPGMTVLPQPGTNSLNHGELLQVGATHLGWKAFPGSDGQTAGVGLAARKAALLADPARTYVLHTGTIPTAGLPDGDYTVMLVPVATRTLRDDVDLATDQPGFIQQAATAAGSSFSFTLSDAPVPGDCDGDRDIDLADFLVFQACFTGAGAGPLDPTCTCADLDGDGDSDLADLIAFQSRFEGSQ